MSNLLVMAHDPILSGFFGTYFWIAFRSDRKSRSGWIKFSINRRSIMIDLWRFISWSIFYRSIEETSNLWSENDRSSHDPNPNPNRDRKSDRTEFSFRSNQKVIYIICLYVGLFVLKNFCFLFSTGKLITLMFFVCLACKSFFNGFLELIHFNSNLR